VSATTRPHRGGYHRSAQLPAWAVDVLWEMQSMLRRQPLGSVARSAALARLRWWVTETVRSGFTVPTISKQSGIPVDTLYDWIRKAEPVDIPDVPVAQRPAPPPKPKPEPRPEVPPSDRARLLALTDAALHRKPGAACMLAELLADLLRRGFTAGDLARTLGVTRAAVDIKIARHGLVDAFPKLPRAKCAPGAHRSS
jgi:transposase-like protein